MVRRKKLRINVFIFDEHAEYLRELKELGLNMTQFVKQAIEYYAPIHLKKIEVLLRYKKAMENYSPIMNEEKKVKK